MMLNASEMMVGLAGLLIVQSLICFALGYFVGRHERR